MVKVSDMRTAVRFRCTFFALALLLATAGVTGAADEEASSSFSHLSRVLRTSKSALVVVRGFVPAGEDGSQPVSENTGFFIDESGHVVTSQRVLVQKGYMEVLLPSGLRAEGEIVGVDQHMGLALLATGLNDTSALEPAESNLEAKDWFVTGFARPDGKGGAAVFYSGGLLAEVGRCVRICGMNCENLLALGVPVPRGAAAAPVLNERGRLAGVIAAAECGEESDCKAYALPVDEVMKSVRIMRNGGRRLGWLGLALKCPEGTTGGVVMGVMRGSPAEEAGIRPGDVVMALDGHEVTCASSLEESILKAEPGQEIEARVRREGKERRMTVEVGTRPLLIPSMTSTSPGDASRKAAFAVSRSLRDEYLRREMMRLRNTVQELRRRLEELKRRGDSAPQHQE